MVELTDKEQEELCKYCEDVIIEGCGVSSTFLCEGRFCEEAYEKFTEDDE